MSEPLKLIEARNRARKILESGSIVFTSHAARELDKDDLTRIDAMNIIRAGVYQPPEYEQGAWRYRVMTQRMAVVLEFASDSELVVITGWRFKK
mgnify:CR=1 FL=1